MIQTADGALGEITSILQRMRENHCSSKFSNKQRIGYNEALATEFNGLRDEVASIVSYTKWNERTLLDGSVDGTRRRYR